ncbi:hypothetical protein ACVI1J_010166 [Bradyrhizobium diazoefficiens]|uniref:hypothetical protein n=1 Tax=Bradyrhizobium TaxID=374 RepID=UPI0012FDF899|nr:hypothetical protein [Bradyrhizobium liaoningense]
MKSKKNLPREEHHTNRRGEAMTAHSVPQTEPQSPASDILEGAEAIAEFLFGGNEDDRDRNKRKIYYLAENSRLPLFLFGTMLCARKSVLLAFISRQEERGLLVG